MARLERRGMVEVLEGRPMKYRALPPSQVAEDIKVQLGKVAAQAEEALLEELQPLYTGEGEEGFVRLIKSWNDVEAALRSMVSAVRHELVAHVGWVDASYVDSFMEQVARSVERGVKVKVLVSKSCAKAKELTKLAQLAEVRVTSTRAELPINVLVADGSQALFILTSKARRSRLARRLAVRIAVKELAELIKEYVEAAWKAGREPSG